VSNIEETGYDTAEDQRPGFAAGAEG